MLRTSFLALLGTGLLALGLPLVYGEAPPDAPPGVEVQAHGPIHEAFAQPVTAQPTPGPTAPKEPPPLIDEVPPDQKPNGDNVQWIPGYWQWDDDKSEFLWISGFWRQAPPGRAWIAGRYTKTANGWQWTSGYWSGADKQPLLPEPPAPVQAEPATPPPSDDSTYVPGTWVYRDARYRWRAPYYLDYRPGWVWQPAQYVWTPNGCMFVDGYWDYPLDQRGMLFAPVAIDPTLLAQPNWTYTPNYVVNCDFLPTALFVRPGWNHYYFGDYFGAGYARRGFTPWIDYRIGRRGYDPLFAYYRHGADAARWERDLRGVYAGRHAGNVVLPPRTWAQQQALVHKITVDKSVSVGHLRHVTALTPLAHVDRKAVPLRNASPAERRVAQPRDAVRPRHEAETHVVPNHSAPSAVTRNHVTPAPHPAHAAPAHAAPAHVAPKPAPHPARAAPAHAAPAHHAAASGHHKR